MKSRDGRRGCLVPYADPRAYTDRLNKCVSAAGWTRTYSVTTLSPVTRMEKDKPIQTGKVIVTCVVTIEGLGSHSGTGEKWADDQNAATSAEAQAFKRACACFGLGRYFYNVPGVWVDLDEFHQPKSVPSLPGLGDSQERFVSQAAECNRAIRPTAKVLLGCCKGSS